MVFLLLQKLTWAQCTYDVKQHNFSNTLQISDIPTLIDSSKGCTTLLELWASWCGPCRTIAPNIDVLVQKYPDIVVHQISVDEKEVLMKKFIFKIPLHSPPYRLSTWTINELKNTFLKLGGTFEAAIPYILLLDPEGQIVVELTEPKDLQAIEAYLSTHEPPKKKNKN